MDIGRPIKIDERWPEVPDWQRRDRRDPRPELVPQREPVPAREPERVS
jgi:hypothetical protein